MNILRMMDVFGSLTMLTAAGVVYSISSPDGLYGLALQNLIVGSFGWMIFALVPGSITAKSTTPSGAPVYRRALSWLSNTLVFWAAGMVILLAVLAFSTLVISIIDDNISTTIISLVTILPLGRLSILLLEPCVEIIRARIKRKEDA